MAVFSSASATAPAASDVAGTPRSCAAKRQVPPDRHLVVERRRVGQEADPPANLVGIAGDVDAIDRHLAGGRQEHAPQHLQRGALPGAVEAQEADHLAALDGEAEIVDGGVLAVVLGQSFDFNHREVGAGEVVGNVGGEPCARGWRG